MWHPFLHRWQIIPTVQEQPVKSLGSLYAFPLTDRHRGVKVKRTTMEGLRAIEKSELSGKLKAWCFQHGLAPPLLWPLQIYKISLSLVWNYPTVHQQIPLQVVGCDPRPRPKEFQVGKARLHMAPHDALGLTRWRHTPSTAWSQNWNQVVSS